MASIKDSLEETYQDTHSVIKFIIYSIPLFYNVYIYTKNGLSSDFYWLLCINFILFAGFTLKCTQNVRKGFDYVLPPFNIFKTIWTGIVGTVVLIPLIATSFGLGYFFTNLIFEYIPDPLYAKIFAIIVNIILSSIIFTGYILYAKDFKFLNAYNINLISKHCIDILIELFFLLIKLFFVNLLIILPIGYLLWLFLGLTNLITYYAACLLLVYNFAIIGHYLAQIDYEIIQRAEETD